MASNSLVLVFETDYPKDDLAKLKEKLENSLPGWLIETEEEYRQNAVGVPVLIGDENLILDHRWVLFLLTPQAVVSAKFKSKFILALQNKNLLLATVKPCEIPQHELIMMTFHSADLTHTGYRYDRIWNNLIATILEKGN